MKTSTARSKPPSKCLKHFEGLPLSRFAASPSLATREGDDILAAGRLLLDVLDLECASFQAQLIDSQLADEYAPLCPGVFLFGQLESLARFVYRDTRHAARRVIVDHAHGLHQRVHGGGADKLPAALFEFFG